MKLNILETICANKQLEVARQKEILSFDILKKHLETYPYKGISFKQSLVQSNTGIIAEFKRCSPSKGWINQNADIEAIVRGYEITGAATISVLTDEMYFGATPNDFSTACRIITKIPILRKDFIIDEYQIYQSKAMGADVILLIASLLSTEESFRFTEIAHQLDMEVLLEIHNKEELDYIQSNVDVIGINNRDLRTFVTDIQYTIELACQIPKEYVKISESGLSQPQTVSILKKEGFNGFLIGEYFMKTENPVQALKEFVDQL
ncbi:MAG: indole-3-glycerol phosphate synthase TrpC [Candidatus Azobacteroides pseudotrichonymphae]|jgi:indole-3-glycerol phosphate synthase|uniref:indole-3-glycerol-phosphate synthase n=1 Tax=Azobacteroides pseudotrichonymphae genomovar. CFP2 TaxID=511995 RepID=B6YR32_AZOPC|nr:indole-3-glycerol phosphate synthase TrpC [Candidatus Azobacteroides pseudotrichonymphae]MDR0529946.1 indole-3-glycerol phosphate synthase TrpC [Bacteroidales bacterium OttesenSCG-928-I14]BAG83654.1 indole-3-glycerol phosphate synthase [Candidatus Azobacteroides pseudotrichonymphae genomovar. CFP2]GMO32149.1 MAG: indole-3-glycerol phosphate synthase TrpC [Candidatus Azobacteroides pseudotrichonymphae]